MALGQTPTLPATITEPESGTVTAKSEVQLRGTCEENYVVKIVRNDLGSTICDVGGTFKITISLFKGLNVVEAQTSNFADQPGPSSNPINITYNPPPPIAGTTPSPNTPSPPNASTRPPTPSQPSPPAPQLVLETTIVTRGVQTGDVGFWTVDIKGGTPPFAVQWDWGDGQTELISQAGNGPLRRGHLYEKSGHYTIKIRIVDKNGQTGYIEFFAVVSDQDTPMTTTQSGIDFQTIIAGLAIAWPVYLVAFLMLFSYWLGEQREKKLLSRK